MNSSGSLSTPLTKATMLVPSGSRRAACAAGTMAPTEPPKLLSDGVTMLELSCALWLLCTHSCSPVRTSKLMKPGVVVSFDGIHRLQLRWMRPVPCAAKASSEKYCVGSVAGLHGSGAGEPDAVSMPKTWRFWRLSQ